MTYNNVALNITYDNDWSPAFKKYYGHGMTKLEVKSVDKTPLPISKTGYLSRFISEKIVDEQGGVETLVKKWLAEGENKREWKAYLKQEKAKAQLSLF